MNKVLTLKGFSDLIELGYKGDSNTDTDANTIAILSGVTSSKIKKMKPHKYAEFKDNLLKQSVASNPVYMFIYKGKTYGYNPPELDSVEAMAGMEMFLRQKNWNALAALMFQEVKTISKIWHRNEDKFKDRLGVKVKDITSFSKNYMSYAVKKVDFTKVDLEYWDDLPANLLISNLAFLTGNGLLYNLSIPFYSLRSEKLMKQKILLSQEIQKSITSLILQNIASALGYLNSTVDPQSQSVNPESSLAGWNIYTSTKSIAKIKEISYNLSGVSKNKEIDGFISFFKNLINGDIHSNDMSLLSNIGTLHKQTAKIGLLYG